MPVKKPRRRTPWNAERQILSREANRLPLKGFFLQEANRPRQNRPRVILLEGLCVFDPAQVTGEDIRQFLWAGLRELRVYARAKGWEEEEVRQLLSSTFEVFHDKSESIWAALKAATSSTKPGGGERVTVTPSSFDGEEDDRPVPVKMDFRKPLTLLDPDAELLASFEP